MGPGENEKDAAKDSGGRSQEEAAAWRVEENRADEGFQSGNNKTNDNKKDNNNDNLNIKNMRMRITKRKAPTTDNLNNSDNKIFRFSASATARTKKMRSSLSQPLSEESRHQTQSNKLSGATWKETKKLKSERQRLKSMISSKGMVKKTSTSTSWRSTRKDPSGELNDISQDRIS